MSAAVSMEGAAASAMRLPEVAKYEYHDDVTSATVEEDLKLIGDEWNKRLSMSIADEAKRTNSWSLLWKMEAAIVSLQRVLFDRILRLAKRVENERGVRGIQAKAAEVVRESQIAGDVEQKRIVALDADAVLRGRADYVRPAAVVPQQRAPSVRPVVLIAPIKSDDDLAASLRKARSEEDELKRRQAAGKAMSSADLARLAQLANEIRQIEIQQQDRRADAISAAQASILGQPGGRVVRPARFVRPTVIDEKQERQPTVDEKAADAGSRLGNFIRNLAVWSNPANRISETSLELHSTVGNAASSAASTVADVARYAVGQDLADRPAEPTATIASASENSLIGDYARYAIGMDLPDLKNGGGVVNRRKPPRTAGANTSQDDAKELLALYKALRDTINKSDTMFSEMKRWITACGGELDIPFYRPPVTGLDPIVARIVERLVWPRLQPSIFPIQRQMTLYGPSGGGKSIVTSLIAYEAVAQLKGQYLKTAFATADDAKLKAESLALPASRFMIVYYVDATKLRNASAATVAHRLRNYLNCLQFEVVRASRRSTDSLAVPGAAANNATGPLALLVLDDFDAIFATDDELKKRPRRARNPAALYSDNYRLPQDVPGFLRKLQSNVVRTGGDGSATTTTAVTDSVSNVIAALPTEWPDVRILRLERYPWLVPTALRTRVPRFFVDLPNAATRRSIITTAIDNLLFRNLSAWLDEYRRLRTELTADRIQETKLDAEAKTARRLADNEVGGLLMDDGRRYRTNQDLADRLDRRLASIRRKIRRTIWILNEDWRPPCSRNTNRRNRQEGPASFVNDEGPASFAYEATIEQPYAFANNPDGNEYGAGSGLEGAGAVGCAPSSDARLLMAERRLRYIVAKKYDEYLKAWLDGNTVRENNWRIMATVIDQTPGANERLAEYRRLLKPTIELLVATTGFALNGYCRLQTDGRLSQSEADTYLIMTGRRGPRGEGLYGETDFGMSVDDLTRFMSFLRQVVATRQIREALADQRAFIYGSETLAAPGCRRTARDAMFQTGSEPPFSIGTSELDAPAGTLLSSTAASRGIWRSPTPGFPTSVTLDPAEASTCALALGPDLRTLQDGAPAIPLSARFGSMRILKDDAIRAMRAFLPSVSSKNDYPSLAAFVMKATPNPVAPVGPIAAVCRPVSVPVPPVMSLPVSDPLAPPPERFAAWKPLLNAAERIA